jgi:hypothetical protein
MKIGVIIPDRGDRPQFLDNCIRMINNQSLKPDDVFVVGHTPISEKIDITFRYRIGYEYFRFKNYDVVFLIENDDWYSNDYFKIMIDAWKKNNKPNIFGTNYTIYYHLLLKAWKKMEHFSRASAMNTILKPDLDFEWCSDYYAFTDLHLWSKIKGVTFTPEKIISLGIKHGHGLCGGHYHNDRLNRFVNDDVNFEFLKSTTDKTSFEFYNSIYNNEKAK